MVERSMNILYRGKLYVQLVIVLGNIKKQFMRFRL